MAGIQYEIHGELYEFDEEPSAEMLSGLAAQLAPKGNTPGSTAAPKEKKPTTSFWEDIKTGYTDAANAIDTGVTFAGRGLETIVGHDRSIEDEDALFGQLEERKRQRREFANPDKKEQTFGGKAIGMAASLPAQMIGMAGQSAERGEAMINNGESTENAQSAVLMDTLLNTAALAAPASWGKGIGTKMVTGAASNVATGAASDAYTSGISETDATKQQFDPFNVENRGLELILGAGFGAAGGRSKVNPPSKDAAAAGAKAEELLKASELPKAATKAPETPLPELLPEFREEASQMPPLLPEIAPDRALPPIDGTPPELPGTPQPKVPAQPLPETNPYMMSPDAAPRPLPEVPMLPEAPRMASEPLPAIDGMTPSLPSRSRRTGDPETPLPEIDAHIMGERAPGMEVSQIPETSVSAKVGGGRRRALVGGRQSGHFNYDNLLIDLFGDKLKPGIKAQVRHLRNQAAKATTEAEMAKIEADFAALVQKHGQSNDPIAIARALHETKTDPAMPIKAMRKQQGMSSSHAGPVGLLGEAIVAGSRKMAEVLQRGYLRRVARADDKSGRKVWRATRPGQETITGGDWVSPDKDTAQQYAAGGRVVEDYLPAKDLYEKHPNGWLYAPEGTDIGKAVRTGRRDAGDVKTIEQDYADFATGQKPRIRTEFDARTTLEAKADQRTADLAKLGITPEVRNGLRRAAVSVGKRQQGILHDPTGGTIGKIADYIQAISKKPTNSTSPLSLRERQIEAIKNVPGMELSGMIAKDADPEAIRADLKNLPDITNGLGDAVIGSKEMQAQIKRNPVMYAVGNLFTNARKRFELYDTVALKPYEQAISKLVRSGEADSLMAVLMAESKAKRRLNDEQLAQVLNDKQIAVYKKHRQEMDIALAKQNAALPKDKQITEHEAYMASRWGGQWRTPVYDKDGNVVWWIAERSKARAEHALEWLKKNEPDLDYSRSKIDYRNQSLGSEGKNKLAGYREMLAIVGEDSELTTRLQQKWEEKMSQEGFRAHGHDKHFEPKGGTKGHAGARPWENRTEDVRAFFEAQMSYLRESHLWAEQQTAVETVKKILYDTDLQKSHGNTLDWMREMARNELGSSTAKAAVAIEHSIAKALGTDPFTANKHLGTLKSYFYATKLGFFNVPFAVMSIVQPVFTMPHHIRLSDQGYQHNGLKTMIDSMIMTAGTVLPKLVGDATMHKRGPLSSVPKLYQDAFKYMEANGIVNLNQFSDVGHVNRSENTRRVLDVINYSITAPEKIARTTAFMGYVSHLNQSGKFKGDEMGMFQKAEELTNLSMANFKHTERAPVFNRAGLAGNALVTLQTFKINQLNQLYDFGKGAAKGEGMKPLAAMLMIQATMAGAMGMYGIEHAEWLVKWIKKGLNELGIYDEGMMEFSPKKWMLENLPALASMGLTSQIMGGKDYHSRLDQGTILDPTFAGMLPFLNDIAEQVKDVAVAVANPTNAEKRDRAIQSVMPSSLKGFNEMGGFMSNTLTGAPGQGDAFSADRPDEPLYKRTQADKDARGTFLHGVPTLTEAREKTHAFKLRETEGLAARQLAIQTEKFHSASRTGDNEAKAEAIRKVARLGGDWEALIDGEVARLEKRATTAQEKDKLQALKDDASLAKLMKVKRQLEATKKMRANH
jgi:hypothetical protein